ncbi:hypothetical protein LDO51_07775 [Providencia alcalifaciens]|uniref:hypothetical protein n=1 Tax=Providencia alcalifaciens TaxID=126385 RepID=UPI001CE0681C|nr:hypothetical protein [Providencia alcalifaciens]UBX50673.1 hypothetical protein LDO51_07775 [Providencia alcalifaciens]
MIKNINPRSESIININDNKTIATSSLSNKIKKTSNIGSCIPDNNRLSNLHYQKKHFAVSTCHFEPSEQKEINLIKYSPPVEKITLPYKYHEAIEANGHFLILKSPRIFNHSVSIKNEPLINEKQDAELMLIDKISVPETNVFKEFNLKRSSNRFSNLILEIKSTHEKGIRYLKNIFKKNNNEQFSVTFKKETETQKKHEITKENNVITYRNTASTQKVENNLNTLKSLKANLAEQLKKIETDKKNTIKADEEKIRKEAASSIIPKISISKKIDENKTKNNNNEFEFNDELEWNDDTNNIQDSLQEKITRRLVSLATPSTHQLDKLLVDKTDMKSINRLLKDMDSLNERESKLSSSNESLNSDSSGYKSDISRSSNETQKSFTPQKKLRANLLSPKEEMNPNEQSGIESKKYGSPQKNIPLASTQVSKENIVSSSSHANTHTMAARKSTVKTKVTNRRTVGLEQTQAEKMARLTKGHSTTGYIHPSRRAKPTSAEKEQKIKQLDEQISKLLAMKKETQAMLDTTTKEEQAVNQLIIETKNDVAALKHKLKA